MGNYSFSAPARQDLRQIKNYMAQFSLSAASRFLDAFEEKCRLLADFSDEIFADVRDYTPTPEKPCW
ncbi:MAG: type II toxin-antitoxin system RelE/ParE family toxin [Coleofasciculus sp. G1-WW12-02]|uniref:type II toxin-antitoxin system RelE/ParE family toxin n=1 Tax=Coleofasciculus sp. G1-WW12-02 TaxID=3068483 RepID=UPI0032FF0DAC